MGETSHTKETSGCYCSRSPEREAWIPPYPKEQWLARRFTPTLNTHASWRAHHHQGWTTGHHLVLCGDIQNWEAVDWSELLHHCHPCTWQLWRRGKAAQDIKTQRGRLSENLGTQEQRRIPNNHGTKERSRSSGATMERKITDRTHRRHIIIRDIGLNARGKLDCITREIASELDIPHHCGA